MPQRPLEARRPVAPPARRPAGEFRARVRFRAASADDVPALVPMINEAYARENWLFPNQPRTNGAHLAAELQGERTRMVVAEIDGELAGCITVWLHEGEPDFGLLAVAPAWQGHGLARPLVEQAEAIALKAGHDAIGLHCVRELGMPSFYESLGYVTVREEPRGDRAPRSSEPCTRVIMRRQLR